MTSAKQTEQVRAFLSCSIRPADRPLVAAIAEYVLKPMGFNCVTVGRNVSGADHVDDVVRKYIAECDCLIGIATKRLSAADSASPDRTLLLATPYLLQETAMAHQGEVPFLILKTPEVTLQGVTGRNLYLEIRPELTHRGRASFLSNRDLVLSSLRDLKARALQRQAQRRNAEIVKVGLVSLGAVGAGKLVVAAADRLMRPDCFGEFYYRDKECKDCNYRTKCKAEKALRQG